MCQVHTGAYVSLLAPGKTDYTACHPRKTTTYNITRSIYHYTYARQTQVNWKKETKKEKEIKERKEKRRKRKKKGKTKGKKRKDKRSKKIQDKKRNKEGGRKKKMSY